MVRCASCGEIFHEEDIDVVKENVGDYMGMPAYQEFGYCPFCGSDELQDDWTEDYEDEL